LIANWTGKLRATRWKKGGLEKRVCPRQATARRLNQEHEKPRLAAPAIKSWTEKTIEIAKESSGGGGQVAGGIRTRYEEVLKKGLKLQKKKGARGGPRVKGGLLAIGD